jgi:hypothetical protein
MVRVLPYTSIDVTCGHYFLVRDGINLVLGFNCKYAYNRNFPTSAPSLPYIHPFRTRHTPTRRSEARERHRRHLGGETLVLLASGTHIPPWSPPLAHANSCLLGMFPMGAIFGRQRRWGCGPPTLRTRLSSQPCGGSQAFDADGLCAELVNVATAGRVVLSVDAEWRHVDPVTRRL